MPTLRDVLQAILGRRLSNPGREFFNAAVESGDWTATIQGSGTAGTYEIASQFSRYTRIGRRIWLDVIITMAGVVTGGGTGYLKITGLPFAKAISTTVNGSVWLDGVGFTANAYLSAQFVSSGASSELYIAEVTNGAAYNPLAIVGLGANDRISLSISYETDDP